MVDWKAIIGLGAGSIELKAVTPGLGGCAGLRSEGAWVKRMPTDG